MPFISTIYRVLQKKVCTCVFAISQLPRYLKKWVCTFFNSPPCAESKNQNQLINRQSSCMVPFNDMITFYVIKQLFYQLTHQFSSRIKISLILNSLQDILYKTNFLGIFETEKLQKQKCTSKIIKFMHEAMESMIFHVHFVFFLQFHSFKDAYKSGFVHFPIAHLVQSPKRNQQYFFLFWVKN